MKLCDDERIVLTLDAGGTNLVFGAIQACEEIVQPVILPSNGDDLTRCLETIILGFKKVIKIIKKAPVAISFAFPGPADYKNGVIGDLVNLKCFRGGIPLAAMLQDEFQLPTFINNDGDLFTYGEAIAGILPSINAELKKNGSSISYNSLLGITLGTGFGGGIVNEMKLLRGSNFAAGEIWLTRNFQETRLTAEESVSIRAVQYFYASHTKQISYKSPEEIYRIAIGEIPGNSQAANMAFNDMALIIGESLANALTLLDAPVVIGGGLSGANSLILPKIVSHLNGSIQNRKGERLPRLLSKCYNLDDRDEYRSFTNISPEVIDVPFSNKKVEYLSSKVLPIATSRLGTSKAVSIGAYAYAINFMNSEKRNCHV